MLRLIPDVCLLDECLLAAGMTRSQLARKTNLDRRYLSRVANGDITVMSLPIAVLIADAIGCSPRDLYVWEISR